MSDLEGDKRSMLYIVVGIFIGLDTIAVVLRFISRRIGRVRWNSDDALVYLGLFFTLAFNILVLGKWEAST